MTAKDTDELMHLLQDTKTTAQLQTYTNTLAEQTILQTFPEYLNLKMIVLITLQPRRHFIGLM